MYIYIVHSTRHRPYFASYCKSTLRRKQGTLELAGDDSSKYGRFQLGHRGLVQHMAMMEGGNQSILEATTKFTSVYLQ